MATSTLVSVPAHGSSQRLLGAALAGLLCVATASCTSKQDAAGSGNAGSAGEPGSGGTGVTATGGSTTTGGAAGAPATAGDSGAGGAAGSAGMASGASDTAGSGGTDTGGTQDIGAGGAAAEPPHITSSMNVGVLTVEDFTALCNKRGGVVEVMPHCGGFATAKGFSYDSGPELLSEHTCAGANTCAGWNCAITD